MLNAATSSKALRIAVVAAVLTAAAALLVVPAYRESQTADEAVYLVGGLSYWKTRDFRLNVEHPPLIKELLALPLIAAGARFSPDASDWNGASPWDVAPKALYRNVLSGQTLLFYGRFVNIALTLCLIVLAAAWSRKTWGNGGALVTLLLVAFEPNVLANGHLATTDVGYTLGILASLFFFGRYLEHQSAGRLVAAALVISAALLTRFNALLLILLLPLQYVIVNRTSNRTVQLTARQMRTVGVVFLAAFFLLTWAAYGFEVRSLSGPQDQAARSLLEPLGSVGTLVTKAPLPAASYLSGLLWQAAHNANGQPAYLFGRTSGSGWWYYFPLAMTVKMTLASLLLAAAAFTLRRLRREAAPANVFSFWYVAVPFAALLVSTMFSRLDIGVRYALPSVVLLAIAGGGAVHAISGKRAVSVTVIAVLLVWHVVSVVRFAPHFLPYANEAFGGPRQLQKYLIDANLDWGQDLPLVREYLAARGITDYRFESFTTAPAQPYGLVEKPVPTDQEVASAPFRGVIVIGVSVLYYPTMQYEWLKRLQPTAVLGDSIYVYDLR